MAGPKQRPDRLSSGLLHFSSRLPPPTLLSKIERPRQTHKCTETRPLAPCHELTPTIAHTAASRPPLLVSA
ncbi:hypothetical protein BDV93DRAFT_160070 [Ceratobasidium sp. AG-I]|nr:hypothetical protein BDV93DRAFT_160070 [Ceratobasidium sp. AG-I]